MNSINLWKEMEKLIEWMAPAEMERVGEVIAEWNGATAAAPFIKTLFWITGWLVIDLPSSWPPFIPASLHFSYCCWKEKLMNQKGSERELWCDEPELKPITHPAEIWKVYFSMEAAALQSINNSFHFRKSKRNKLLFSLLSFNEVAELNESE